MLNGIKSMILEKESYMEAAGIIFEDAAHGGIDDLIILNESADVPEDDEKEIDPDHDGDDDLEKGDDDEKKHDDEDDDITNIPLDSYKEPLEDGDNPDKGNDAEGDDLLAASIDDEAIGAGTLSPGDDLPPVNDSVDDFLNVSIDLRSNTITDVLPVPPDNAGEAIADDILETRVDSGFSESVKDDCPTDDEIPEMRKQHGNGKSPQIGAIKKKLENGQKLTNREQVILRMHYSHKPPMNNARTSTDIYLDKVLTDNHGGKKVTIDSKLDSRFNESTDDILSTRVDSGFQEEAQPEGVQPGGFPMEEKDEQINESAKVKGNTYCHVTVTDEEVKNVSDKEFKLEKERLNAPRSSTDIDANEKFSDHDIRVMIAARKKRHSQINESSTSFLEAISLDGGGEEKPADGGTPDDPGDPPAEEGGENEVTAAVKDKVAEADAPIDDAASGGTVTGGKEALLKKLGSLTKGLEDAKKAVMDTIQ